MDSEINLDEKDSFQIDEVIQEESENASFEYPRFRIIRGEEVLVETIQFTPKSLMTIRVEGTGSSVMTTVLMVDHLGQIRYKSSNGGEIHEYVTRLQNTRSYGRWKLVIDGVMKDEIRKFEIEIPFFVVKEIDDSLDEPIYQPDPIVQENIEDEEPPILDENTIHEDDGDLIEDPTDSSLLDEVLKDELKENYRKKPSMIIKNSKRTVIQEDDLKDGVGEDTEDQLEVPNDVQEDDIKTDEQTDEQTDELNNEVNHEENEVRVNQENYDRNLPFESSKTFQDVDIEVTGFESDPDIETSSHKLMDNDNVTSESEIQTETFEKEAEDKDAGTITEELNQRDYFDEMLKEVGSTKLERIKELFIPLDELQLIDNDELNKLNIGNIYYIEEFLSAPRKRLTDITQYSQVRLDQIIERIQKIITDEKDPVYQKYLKLGEIEDNSLYYSTINVTELKGIGPKTYEKLQQEGIESVTDFADGDLKQLSEISGFSVRKTCEFLVEAQALVYKRINLIDHSFQEYYDQELGDFPETSQLDLINGIGPEVLNELYGIGINNLKKLVQESPQKLASVLNMTIFEIIPWIFEAQLFYRNRFSIQLRYV